MQTVLTTLLVAIVAGTIGWAQQRPDVTADWLAGVALPVHQSTIALRGGPSIDLRIASAAGGDAVDRLQDTARRALQIFSDSLGPPALATLNVVDLPWNRGAPGTSFPGFIATRTRLIAPARDLAAERGLIAGIARQFWYGTPGGPDAWFLEGLTIYTATQGIHAALEGRNFAAPRFAGGFVSMPLRPLLLSPSPQGPEATLRVFDEVVDPPVAAWRFAEAGPGSSALRAATALYALERTIGWAAMQQALAAARTSRAPLSPEALAAIVAEQNGLAMEWFARDVVRGSAPIDYAVGAVQSAAVDGRFRSSVIVRKSGRGVFAGTDRPRADGPARSIAVLVRFEDGSETRTFVDGRDESSELAFDSAAPVAAVLIDPDHLVVVDDDRSNNGWLAGEAPANRTGLRQVLNWMVWLQNVMLTYTSIV